MKELVYMNPSGDLEIWYQKDFGLWALSIFSWKIQSHFDLSEFYSFGHGVFLHTSPEQNGRVFLSELE